MGNVRGRLFWIVLFALLSAVPSIAAEGKGCADPVLISRAPLYTFHSLALDGNYAAWIDQDRSGEEPSVHVYNLTASREEPVSLPDRTDVYEGTPVAGHPALSGPLLAWEKNHAIRLWNLTERREILIPAVSAADRSGDPPARYFPDLDGDRIVWAEQSSVSASQWQRQVMLHNLTTGTIRRLSPTGADQTRPVIEGDSVVWVDFRHGVDEPCIVLHTLSTGNEREIPAGGLIAEGPRVNGRTMVWAYLQNGISRVAVYDIPGGRVRDIDPGSVAGQMNPQVSGDRIIWLQSLPSWLDRQEKIRIFQLDLRTGEILPVDTAEQEIADPVIAGTRIVYARIGDDPDVSGQRQSRVYTAQLFSLDLQEPAECLPSGTETGSAENPRHALSGPADPALPHDGIPPPPGVPGFGMVPALLGTGAAVIALVRMNS